MSNKPLMPKATACWLVDNTMLTFEQIADFTGMHRLEIQAIADGEVAAVIPRDPIAHGEITQEELDRCEKSDKATLKMAKSDLPQPKQRSKGPKYTPVAKRALKPDAISWLLKHHPELNDAQITKLIGTTKNTINSIRERTHANMSNLNPRSPVEMDLCSWTELRAACEKGIKAGRKPLEVVKAPEEEKIEEDPMANFDFSNFMTGTNSSSE